MDIYQDEKLKNGVAIAKAILMIKKGRYEEVLKIIDEEHAWRNTPIPWFLKALIFFNQDKFEEALSAINRALELDKSNPVFWAVKGYILDSLGRYEEGLHALDNAIKIYPNSEILWGVRGQILMKIGKLKEALHASSKCVKINPSSTQIYSSLAHDAKG